MLDEEVDTRTLHQIWWIWTSEGGLASIFNKPLCTRELKAHSWKLCTCVARLGHTTSKEVYLASRACTMTWLPWPGGQKAAWSLGHRDYNIPRAEGDIYALLSCAPSLVRSSCSRKKKKKATSSLLPSPIFTKISHQDKGGTASFQTNSWQSRRWMEYQSWSKLFLRLSTLPFFTFIPPLKHPFARVWAKCVRSCFSCDELFVTPWTV